jgi:outer membrane protein TolC
MDKALWTKNLGLQTDVRYGTFDVFSTNTSVGQNPSTQSTLNSQFNYGVGGFIKIPIYEALSRKDMIRSDKLEIEQTQNLLQSQRDEIRQLVITRYNDLILRHKVFVIKTKYAETIKINMQLAEKEFQNGVLNLDTYSRVCDTYARSEADFEGVKMDFQTAYMTFEVIVGMKFNIYH